MKAQQIETSFRIDQQFVPTVVSYEDLREESDPMCWYGQDINGLIAGGFDVPEEQTLQMHQTRVQYWLDTVPETLKDRVPVWNGVFEKTIGLAELTEDSSGLPRDMYWLSMNMVLFEEGARRFPGMDLSEEMKQTRLLYDKALGLSHTLPPDQTGVRLESQIYTDVETERETGTYLSKYYFTVNKGDGLVYPVEVTKSCLDINDQTKRHAVYCAPISIGCPAGCEMCDHGGMDEFIDRPIQLSAAQMVKMLMVPLRDAAYSMQYPDRVKISWFGGGDPAFNPEFADAVRVMKLYYPRSTQAVSTVGVSEKSLQQMLDLADEVDTVSLQVSLLSLDDEVRRSYFAKPKLRKQVLSPQKALDILGEQWKKTGKVFYINLMMWEGIDDDPQSVAEKLKAMNVDPQSIHVTLDRPVSWRNPNDRLKVASEETYTQALQALKDAGYTNSHIYQPPPIIDFPTSCGVVDRKTLEKLRNIGKAKKAEN